MSTSQNPLCCVKGCSLIEDTVRPALFVFPPDTTPRAKRWLQLYPHSFLQKPNVDNYICGRHFTAECFNKNGGLLHRAYPSVNIDTSYAQDIMMRTFLMKVLYEWVLRNSVQAYTLVIWDKVFEAKVFLGMQIYTQENVWTSKFVQFTVANKENNVRFGSGQQGPKNILEIIKDIRRELPSNFLLPADNIMQCTSEEEPVNFKEEEEDVVLNSIFENEDSADEPIQGRDVIPNESLDTYQEALELLKPLKDYIERIGNENASLRLSEIETVVKQVIKNNARTRRSSKRRR